MIEGHSQVPLLPVLKADAYGHGAPVVSAFLRSREYSLLGVSSLEEALGICQITPMPLLVLAPPLLTQLELFIQYSLLPTITSASLVPHLARIARENRQEVTVHVKVDTGFGRLGVAPEEFLSLVQLIQKTPRLRLGGVFTHFSAAFSDIQFTKKQLRTLLELREQLGGLGNYKHLLWHAANSAAFLTLPSSHLDLVRVGTLLYGQSPVPLDSKWDLAETWQFKTRIIQIRTLPKGHSVGYGRLFRTEKPTRIGVIPVGYGHGLELEPQSTPWRQIKQALSKGLKGQRLVVHPHGPLPILGRVGMGLTTLDLTKTEGVQVGDEVRVAMRRVTASGHVPRIYYLDGKVKCVYWNRKILSDGHWKTSSRGLFSKEESPPQYDSGLF